MKKVKFLIARPETIREAIRACDRAPDIMIKHGGREPNSSWVVKNEKIRHQLCEVLAEAIENSKGYRLK